MEKKLNWIIRSILIVFLLFVVVRYAIVNGVSSPRIEQKEKDESMDIFKKVVALVDSRITDKDCTIDEIYGIGYGRNDDGDGEMTKKNFERMKKSALKLVDAKVEYLFNFYTMRGADIWIRYVDENNKNFYVYVNYSEDAMTKRVMDDTEDNFWNAVENGLFIYSDYYEITDRSYDLAYPRFLDYESKQDSDTEFIELDDINSIKSANDYLDFAKTRTSEIRDYLKNATEKTAKNERRISSRIKRAVLSKINHKSYRDYASNERCFVESGKDYYVDIDKIKIIDFEDQIVKRRDYTYAIGEKAMKNVRNLLIVQLVIFGVFWGLCTKLIPKLFGNEYSSFFKGFLYGAISFFVAIFLPYEIHSWLAYGFWLGILPVIEGVVLGMNSKKERS
ncbi:hypothetical protein [Eubacterium sp.]|uniref:hypothetical protein n=1 Tax=Eubacterium sp. TaxID=142586 RepID=UPI0025DBD7BA|nr:hypothetical protein [Eubacterium sp.]MCR5629936.1 hypothetical protein [Eubacterium sp.]